MLNSVAKRCLAMICAVLLCLSVMCSCGKNTPDDSGSLPSADTVVNDEVNEENISGEENTAAENDETEDTDLYPVEEQEEIDQAENQPDSDGADDRLSGTYWRAVRYEGVDSAEGGDEMPMGSWDADMFFFADGTGRFRNMYGASYNWFQPEFSWSYDEGTSRILLQLSDGTETFIHGLLTENGLRVDYNEGDLWFEQAEMPQEGGQWCLADLVGTWKLVGAEIEGYKSTAEEAGMHGSVTFSFFDPELRANYVQYDDFGNRTEFVDAMVVYMDMPLFDGFVNEAWCVELIGDDNNVKCHAAMLDRENLVMLVEYYEEGYEYPAVSVQFFNWEGVGDVG